MLPLLYPSKSRVIYIMPVSLNDFIIKSFFNKNFSNCLGRISILAMSL